MAKKYLTQKDVALRAGELASAIQQIMLGKKGDSAGSPVCLYGVPRGGIPAAYAVQAALHIRSKIVELPEYADFIIDDILDSGETCKRYSGLHPDIPFLTLVDKQNDEDCAGQWIVFPWEVKEDGAAEEGIEDNIRRIMQFIGEDPTREGLIETPKRVAKAMAHWYKGYHMDPAEVLKVFTDGAEGADEMVVVEDIPFFSHCEHHMAPIFGTATIAYIPNGKIIGLSKIPRLLDIFARRMQVQERLTNQVAEALMEHLSPLGCGVMIKARHFCMESRGIEKIGSQTITTALRGVFKDQPSTRNEFMLIARKG